MLTKGMGMMSLLKGLAGGMGGGGAPPGRPQPGQPMQRFGGF
jgi:hypothetical protein